MSRSNRLVQLLSLAAMGIALGTLALMLLGPPSTRTTEPPRQFSVPLESQDSAEAPGTAPLPDVRPK